MTQPVRKRLPASRIALLIAVLVAAFAIGYAISRNQTDNVSESEASSAVAGEPSLEDLETLVKDEPKNAQAWQRLGLAYFELGRFPDAAQAYGRATKIDDGEAIAWSALGESMVMASERDPMPQEAVKAFEKAIALDPKDPRARYFLAVKKDLGGDHQGALTDWLSLLEATPQDAPWREDLVRTIEQVGKINKIEVAGRLAKAGEKSPAPPVAAQAIPGPSAKDLQAASQIPPGEQREMAEGMVSRLENRLKSEPGNVDGWVMLMRSRATLEQPDKARQALADAVAANPDRADFLKQQADVLGLR